MLAEERNPTKNDPVIHPRDFVKFLSGENFFIKRLTELRSNFEGFSRCCCLRLSADVRPDGNDEEEAVVANVGMS